jgi:hypothetical protein
VQDVDGARERRREAEQIGVTGGVVDGTEAAHRQSGHGAPAPVGAGAVAVLDERPQFVEVVRLPALRTFAGGIAPIGVPAACAAVGHDHDKRQAGGQLLGAAHGGPVAGPAEAAVEQPQHGEVVAGRVEPGGREDAHR